MFNSNLAQTNSIINPVLNGLGGTPINSIGFTQKFISSLIGFALIAASLLFFLMFVVGGIRWITSGGDKASLEGAKGTITNALVGLFLVFIVFAITQLIKAVFGVDILTIDIGNLIIK